MQTSQITCLAITGTLAEILPPGVNFGSSSPLPRTNLGDLFREQTAPTGQQYPAPHEEAGR
jgi:hypothetical protein